MQKSRSAAEEMKKSRSSQRSSFILTNLQIVAVTACNRIAHTYMAEEALIKKREEMGVTVRVETKQGIWCRQSLDAEEIIKREGVIIAADKRLKTARFDGKN